MIGKEEFIKLIKWHKVQNERVDDLCKVFPLAFDSPIIDSPFMLFQEIINSCFTNEGINDIDCYLYEPTLCKDSKGNMIDTPEKLWNEVKQYRKGSIYIVEELSLFNDWKLTSIWSSRKSAEVFIKTLEDPNSARIIKLYSDIDCMYNAII